MNEGRNGCRLIEIPIYRDHRGTLAVLEPPLLPFVPQRLYYIYDSAEGARRGGHVHRRGHELIVAVAGRVWVDVTAAEGRQEFVLDRPDRGVYLPPMVWHEVHGFGPNTICAVLASARYDADDSYDDFAGFLQHLQTV
jgi:dTDP-4-dehydrorhamnose 3,5-epimerase-like enzyme